MSMSVPLNAWLMSKVRSEVLLMTRGVISQQSTYGRRKENEFDRRERRPKEEERERERERESWRRRRPGPAGDATYIHINIEQSTGGRRIRTMSVESVISERERENAMKGGG